MTGKLIVFEGPDGVGKTTLIQNTIDFIQAWNVPLLSLSFPGKTPGTLGHLVYQLHHTKTELQVTEINPLALQALHIAAHLDEIESRIKPALASGTIVLLDRTWWSTWVYGQATHVNEVVLAKLIEAEQLAWEAITPAVLFLIQRTTAFKAEHSQEMFTTLSSLYENLATREELRHPVVRLSNEELPRALATVQESIASLLNTPFTI